MHAFTFRLLSAGSLGGLISISSSAAATSSEPAPSLPPQKIHVSADRHGFATADGRPFVPFGVTYYRPGTGWAPQVWKKFDEAATRRDMVRMKQAGVNCVRVFLSFGSFYSQPGVLDTNGLAKFDGFLALAEEQGIYVHPTGPDHWEGLPEWARMDRYADERVLSALELFWRQFAARYRGRPVVFAYDLLNEPEVRWDTPIMRERWNQWLTRRYGSTEKVRAAWSQPSSAPVLALGAIPIPPPRNAPDRRDLLDFQRCREEIAQEWTRRQAAAIKSVDPAALVTVGLIQWSVPAMLAHPGHYSAFRPSQQAPLLDFMELHFYPLENGAYEYRDDAAEMRNLSYLEALAVEVARLGKPVVVAEFGWYGGGKPTFDGGRHPAASEEQQARWCTNLIQTTSGLACGWLNWGFYDQPEATDTSQLSGLYRADGQAKAWGREFLKLAQRWHEQPPAHLDPGPLPRLDWDRCIVDTKAGGEFLAGRLPSFQERHAAASRPKAGF